MSTISSKTDSSLPSNTYFTTSSHYADLKQGSSCPVTGKTYEFCPPRNGDVRSPCPALNALANHGYLPRDGKNIGPWDLVRALKTGYNLSTFLACVLSFGSILILGQYKRVSLSDLARHGLIEHDASLVHGDTINGDEYAPTTVDSQLLAAFCAEGGNVQPDRMTLEDAAQIRVKRESMCNKLDGVHAEIARGEIVIAIGVLGGKDAVGWKPDHTQGFYQTFKMAKRVRNQMKEIRKKSEKLAGVQS